MTVSTAAPQPPPSFLRAAKLREQPLSSITYVSEADAGTPHNRPLRNVGYVSRLDVVVTEAATYATAGPTGVDALNQYVGPIGRVAVRANSIGTIYDVAGYFAPLISAIDSDYNSGSAGLNPAPYTFTAAPGTAATTNKWAFSIPIALNLDTMPSPLGLYQTAISGNETDLEVRFTSIAGATTATPGTALYLGNQANLGGQSVAVAANQVYFDPIPDGQGQPVYGFVHQWLDTQYPLTADGDTDLNLNNANIYCRFILVIVTGAAGALAPDSTHLTRLRITYGGGLTFLDWTADMIRLRMAKEFPNIAFPGGIYVIDLLSETHTQRDLLNASATTDLRLTVTMSGATYTGGAYVRLAYELLTPLTVPANAVGLAPVTLQGG